jgi:putative tricarboxylic transport membrane protein
VKKLSKAPQNALRDPGLLRRFNDINTEPVAEGEATPEARQVKLVSEVDRWKPIIEAAGQFAD